MKLSAVKTRFLQRLEAAGLSPHLMTPAAGVEAMLVYYADERADGCDLGRDGDMLLFQWGIYDWGQGPAFEVNITRQLIVADDEEDEPQQLGLTFRFEPAAGAGAGEANRWCESPDGLPEFRRFVAGSLALKTVGQRLPESVEVRYGRT